jgi:alpha-tubulin suppressor-like RCC1 family protein
MMMKQRFIYGIIAVLVLPLLIGITNVTALTSRIIALPTPQRILPATNGQVTVWGDAANGLHNIPLQAAADVRQIAMGAHHAIALTKTQKVVGWGTNWNGELTIPPTLTDIVQVSVGISHSVALQQNGTVVQWGAASSTSADAPLPTDVVQIAAYRTLSLQQSVLLAESVEHCLVPAL